MPEQSTSFNTWAIVEVLGHKKVAGFVTEQTFGSAALIRVDVPETQQPERRGYVGNRWGAIAPRTTGAYSKLIGVGSIYCITPCTEEVARKAAVVIEGEHDPIPVAIPEERRLAAPTADADDAEDLDEFEVSSVGPDDDDDDAGWTDE